MLGLSPLLYTGLPRSETPAVLSPRAPRDALVDRPRLRLDHNKRGPLRPNHATGTPRRGQRGFLGDPAIASSDTDCQAGRNRLVASAAIHRWPVRDVHPS